MDSSLDSSSGPKSSSAPSMLQENGKAEDVHLAYYTQNKILLKELKSERDSLDPSSVHCMRWIEQEIEKLEKAIDPTVTTLTEKVYISEVEMKHCMRRLFGPMGSTLKQIQKESATKMTVLGRGSMLDKEKEEELRESDEPAYQHLKDDLHVLIEAYQPWASQKLAAGVANVKKLLIPLEPGQPDFALPPSWGGHTRGRGRGRASRAGVRGSRSRGRGFTRGGNSDGLRGHEGGNGRNRSHKYSRPSPKDDD